MKFIGITGGVGAGKSAILSYLAQKPKTKVLLADEIAHELMEPGTECYHQIVEAFAEDDILVIVAAKNFTNEIKKRRTFAIISHPDAGKTTLTEKFLLYGGVGWHRL